VPIVHRIYVRALTDSTYGSAVGVGLADVIHDQLLKEVDWKPTYINSLTASTPCAIRTPIHFSSDRGALEAIAPTVGKKNLSEVTYCRIHNTLELVNVAVSENLIPALAPNVRIVSKPFDVSYEPSGDFKEFAPAAPTLAHA
jgi:hypothetical protein